MKMHIDENSKNYTATVVVITDLLPIEGADKIQRAVIFGNNVIVSKDINVGDVMLYFNSGTQLSEDYCKFNNLYTDPEMNYNKEEKGYVSPKKRLIKAIKLRGIISDGILMPLKSIGYIYGTLIPFDASALSENDSFTHVNGVEVCRKYIVPVKNSGTNPKMGKAVKISRMVDNQFYLHNDTDNLRKNYHKLKLNDIIGIHYKKHGTSVVVGNVLVKRKLGIIERIVKKFGVKLNDTEYDIIYSSRKVVKNGYLNANSNSYYKEDIYGIVKDEIKHLIPKNWTLYGEIVGFLPSGGAIQSMGGKPFDYGCKEGEHAFYVYKISVVNPDGQVIFLTDYQIKEWCEKVGLNYESTLLFYGSMKELLVRYGLVDMEEIWRESLIETLERKFNEKDCHMCVNKQPEEGIILRVEHTDSYEAYKLKSKRFLLGESDDLDKGVGNIEDGQ